MRRLVTHKDRCIQRSNYREYLSLLHRDGGIDVSGERSTRMTGSKTFAQTRSGRNKIQEIGSSVQSQDGSPTRRYAVSHYNRNQITVAGYNPALNRVIRTICPTAVGGISSNGNDFQRYIGSLYLKRKGTINCCTIRSVRRQDIRAGISHKVIHRAGRSTHSNRRAGSTFYDAHRGADRVHFNGHICCESTHHTCHP